MFSQPELDEGVPAFMCPLVLADVLIKKVKMISWCSRFYASLLSKIWIFKIFLFKENYLIKYYLIFLKKYSRILRIIWTEKNLLIFSTHNLITKYIIQKVAFRFTKKCSINPSSTKGSLHFCLSSVALLPRELEEGER